MQFNSQHPRTAWRVSHPDKVIADYRAGWTQYELAEREGCSQAAICAFLREQGVESRPPGPQLRAAPEEFSELHAAGLSQVKIAKQLGISVYIVRRWQRELEG